MWVWHLQFLKPARDICRCPSEQAVSCSVQLACSVCSLDAQHALQVPVNEWRSGLWRKALHSLGIDEPHMAEALQERFRASRLEHFVLDTGVKVGSPCNPRTPG